MGVNIDVQASENSLSGEDVSYGHWIPDGGTNLVAYDQNVLLPLEFHDDGLKSYHDIAV